MTTPCVVAPEKNRCSRPRQPVVSPMVSYYTEVGKTPLLDADEERAVARRVVEGDAEARNEMVLANLRLVVRIAREFCGRGMDLDDLIANGNMGLISAVERFDPAYNVRFSTFAAYWIRQGIQRGIQNTGRSVRFPSHMHLLLTRWRRASAQLQHEELGRIPTAGEVADRLQLTPRKRRAVETALRTWNGTATQSSSTEQSLDEAIEDRRSSREQGQTLTEEATMELLDELEDREAMILRLRFGLVDGQPRTLDEIGRHLNLTRERVRQLERQALATLRERMAG